MAQLAYHPPLGTRADTSMLILRANETPLVRAKLVISHCYLYRTERLLRWQEIFDVHSDLNCITCSRIKIHRRGGEVENNVTHIQKEKRQSGRESKTNRRSEMLKNFLKKRQENKNSQTKRKEKKK